MAATTTDESQAIYLGHAKNYKCTSLEGREKISSEEEEIDEEPDLTSLTWLTELRNQNITFAGSFNITPEDENRCNIEKGSIENIRYNIRSKQTKQGKTNNATTNHHHHHHHQVQAPVKRATPAERYKIFVDKIQRDLLEYKKDALKYQTDSAEKPPFNYSHIIGMAIFENGRVTLQQICAWIEEKFAFFRKRKKWNNSIRHNLSLHYCFRKIDRNKFEKGKGGYWELGVDPKKCERKRVRNRRTNRNKIDSACEKLTSSTTENCDDTSMKVTQVSNNFEYAEKLNVALASLTDVKNLPNSMTMEDFTSNISLTTIDETAESAETQSQHFHLGTIIINSTETDFSSASLNFLGNTYDNWPIQNPNLSTRESESTQASENLIPSYILDTAEIQNQNILLGQLNIVPGSSILRPNVIVEQVLQPNASTYTAGNDVTESGSTILHGVNENFGPYIDGIEEAFQYLRSIDHNNREDILDNILDISVSDY